MDPWLQSSISKTCACQSGHPSHGKSVITSARAFENVKYKKEMRQISLVRNVVFKSLMNDFMPLPVDRSACSKWTTSLPESGETILYTSYLYQLGSVFKSYAKLLERFSGVELASRFTFLGGLIVKPKKEELERASLILNNIARLLRESGTQFAYLYDEEPYSGALLLELGLLEEFQTYGRKLLGFFGERGIRRLITVDPHTFNALLRLKTMLNSDIEVANYLQLVHPRKGEGRFVMHDSCLYSRYLGMRPQVRTLVQGAGIALVENRMVTAQDTSTCCGAPVESVNEELSEQIAALRATRLQTVCEDILVACPLCYQNLSPYAKSVQDIAEVIS
jgi:Fe-S oxidoreductase